MPTCAKCEVEKPESEFRVRPERNNWRVPNCRPCERVTQIDNYYKAKSTDPFLWRFRVIRNNISKEITPEWFEQQWKRQDGRCVLTGRKLDRMTFEVDHIIPRSKGGDGSLANLRFVCEEANTAKADMSDAELLQLCREIIGRAILEEEGLA